MDLTPQTLIDLNRQFRMDFDVMFHQDRPIYWPYKATRVDVSAEVNVYPWLVDLPDWREWIGPRLMRNFVARSTQIKNKDWEFSFSMGRNAILYDQIGLYSERARIAGTRARYLYDKILTDLQTKGNTTKCWDGQFFYDNDHPVDFDDSTAGTYSNSFTALPLNLDNYNTIYETFGSYVGENGQSLELVPTILEVPVALRRKARAILTQDLTAQGIRNVAGDQVVAGAAVDNIAKGEVELQVNSRLPAGVWYMHATSLLKPFVLQVKQDPSPLIGRVAPTDDNVFHRKTFEWGSDAIANGGYGLPFLSIRVSET